VILIHDLFGAKEIAMAKSKQKAFYVKHHQKLAVEWHFVIKEIVFCANLNDFDPSPLQQDELKVPMNRCSKLVVFSFVQIKFIAL
jgi:hypothetical protein